MPIPETKTEDLRFLKALHYVPSIISLYTLEGTPILHNPESVRCCGEVEFFCQHWVDPGVAQSEIAPMSARQATGLKTQANAQTRGICWHQIEVRSIPDPVAGVQMFLVHEQDIPEVMQLEAAQLELRRTERLLQGVAKFSTHLLNASEETDAIEGAIAALGTVAALERIAIWENTLDPLTHQPSERARWQWTARSETGKQRRFAETKMQTLGSIEMPIAIDGFWWGSLVLERSQQETETPTADSPNSNRGWNDSEQSILKIATGAIARFLSATQPLELERKPPTHNGATRPQSFNAPRNHYAYYDALTGLPNRTSFLERLRQAIAQRQQDANYTFAVLFLDLDRFKVVNDSLGHPIGDRLLIAIARHLQQVLRDNDLVARLGGDEFAILLPNTRQLSDATHIADRIHASLTVPFQIDAQEIFTSVSIGIAFSAAGYQHPEEMLRDADIVMYHAKDRGRSRSEVFDGATHDRLVAKLRLEHDLRQTLQGFEERHCYLEPTANAFELYYQPLVELKTGRIDGFEALVRWNHPRLGIVSPEQFISIAEETGLIVSLDHWVLAEACRQLRVWRSQFPQHADLTMSVNLSGRQFSHSNAIAQIDRILERTGVEGKALKLEVTESALIDNADSATEMLLQLKARQIQLCMDDFGTGYSSLNYLHRFPLDTLKIDRSFIAQMDVEEKNLVIVQTIIALARNLGMNVIPEGVETVAQREKLENLGCKLGQGYLFSKPLNRDRASQLLQKTLARRSGEF